jgi:cytochrome P450
MGEYFAGLVDLRRREPADDIVTDLVRAEVDDGSGGTRRLEDPEMVRYLSLVSAAGNETVTNLLGWAALTLCRHPDQRQILLDSPGTIPNAVEELLRYEAPSPIQARLVTADVELHGRTVPAGSKIALLTGSAGRDERQYPDPDRFDVNRKLGGHVSFGQGIHFCLGAALARMEGRVALQELLTRFPSWDVDEEASEMVHTSTVRGWATMPARAS